MPSPLPILTPPSFTGYWKISQLDQVKTDLELLITEWEPKWLRLLFGKALYDLYIAGSSAARFSVLTAAFAEQEDTEGPQYVSDGIPAMLKGFIWYEFVKNLDYRITPNGAVVPASEASEAVSASRRLGIIGERFNKAVDTYRAIQWYMAESEHAEDYPEFSGLAQKKMAMGGALWF